ncbi:MAG: response regulator transcription factor [Bacteroidia bacterium]|nr:response regulator transcription factor [Bacteroidia bacterium]
MNSKTTEKIQVGLVEDQVLFREGMKAILGNWPELEVVFESPDGHSVLDKLQQSDRLPDVMLVDLSLPALGNREFSGEYLTQLLLNTYPEMKILILSVHRDESYMARLIEQGAHGYLAKDSDPQEVYEAIVAVQTKGSYINENTLAAIRNNLGKKKRTPNLPVEITRREVEVLQLVCQQYTAEEIAEKLFISVKTVNGHRNNLLQKTGSRNVTGLVMYALRNGIVDLN